MYELNKLIEELIEEKGGSRKDYLHLMDAIAFHETMGSMDPKAKQMGDGPGRGKYQFEVGDYKGATTAARRAKKLFETKGIDIPAWLDKASSVKSLDVTELTPQQQDVLFLSNMRMHPTADFSKVWKGDQSVEDFWADYHWAGAKSDRKERVNSFKESYNRFSQESPTYPSFIENFTREPNQNTFETGGTIDPTDPPKDKKWNIDKRFEQYQTEKDYVKDWLTNPITIDKFANKRMDHEKTKPWLFQKVFKDKNDYLKETYWDVARGLNKLDKSTFKEERKLDNTVGDYNPNNDEITIYHGLFQKEPSFGVAAHEGSHSTGLDKELSKLVQSEVGYLQLKEDDLPSDKNFKQYLNRGEVFPRIMSLRYRLGLKPGDVVTPEQIKAFYKNNNQEEGRELYKWYGPEKTSELLNKSVYNDNIKVEKNIGAAGGYTGAMSFDKNLNYFNNGGSHETNPYGGIPMGMGSNGKMNTVEQGETTFNLPNGKYVFSNRLGFGGLRNNLKLK